MRNGISTKHDSYSDELNSILRHNAKVSAHRYSTTISYHPEITRITIFVGLHRVKIPVPTSKEEFQYLNLYDFTSGRTNMNEAEPEYFPITQNQLELLLANPCVREDIYRAYKQTNTNRYNHGGKLNEEEVINLIRQAFIDTERKRIIRMRFP